MKRIRRREAETFSLSFLDVIACGFGAVILLLIITLAFEPISAQEEVEQIKQRAADSRAIREDLIKERQTLQKELEEKKRQLAQAQAQLAELGAELQQADRQFGSAKAAADAGVKAEERLKAVQQSLSAEMQRLLAQRNEKPIATDAPIGGIPVDSEYIIFVIDTSGSMKQGAWSLVVSKMREILDSYPKVQGIQVMNDQGIYMFPTYAGQWIPDSPQRRMVILEQLRTWNIFSASNPAPGIAHAITTFYRQDRPTSIFVFGDDFNGRSIDDVISIVNRANRRGSGQSTVRIHTFGFPVLPIYTNNKVGNFTRFAHLMRLLAEQNSGSFVGLNSIK